MAYTQLLKAVHRNIQHTATQFSVQKCKLTQVSVFIRNHSQASAVSRPVLHRGIEFPSSFLSCFIQSQRGFSLDFTARNKSNPEERDKSVSRYQSGSPKLSAAQKVKEAGRDFTYLIVVLIGLGVTGGLLYVVFQELFSSSSPNKVYGKAFDKVKSHPEMPNSISVLNNMITYGQHVNVIGAFGEPIKCYGETTRRGRRQQVSHLDYLKDGLKHMRLKFYIEGSEPGLKGTVHSESIENPENGKYEFRYIFVDIDTYPRRTIIVEDNR